MITTTTSRRTTAPVPRGLNVLERGPLLRGADAAALSSRARAAALTRRALDGAPPTARSLVLELEGDHGLCVLAMGDRAAAVWRFDVAGLRGLAASAADVDLPRLGALTTLREEASRIILGMRLQALRGSIGDVVVVHDRPNALSRLVGAMLLEAIVEHVWLDQTGLVGDATSGAWRETAELRTA